MKLAILSTIALALATAQAYIIPANLTEGVYTVTTAADGTELLTKLSDINTNSTNPVLAKRSTTWPYRTSPVCPTDQRFLKYYDLYSGGAYNSFFGQCQSVGDTKFGNGAKLFSYWGGAVAYMCSYSSVNGGNPCNAQEWADAVSWVQNSCYGRDGPFVQPGWLSIPEWKKAYGYANADTAFC